MLRISNVSLFACVCGLAAAVIGAYILVGCAVVEVESPEGIREDIAIAYCQKYQDCFPRDFDNPGGFSTCVSTVYNNPNFVGPLCSHEALVECRAATYSLVCPTWSFDLLLPAACNDACL